MAALSDQLKALVGPPSVPFVNRFDYDIDGNLIYEGWAECGTPTSAAAWGIKKLTYVDNRVTLIQFLNGGVQQTGVWDNRASLTYA